jgi:hypothetical protein
VLRLRDRVPLLGAIIGIAFGNRITRHVALRRWRAAIGRRQPYRNVTATSTGDRKAGSMGRPNGTVHTEVPATRRK